MGTAKFSIIILNWNGDNIIEECIDSVLQTRYNNIEIIVVDNASTDQSVAKIKKYSQVLLIQNSANSGYAAGNTIGYKAASGDFIVTLNNDMVVDPDWLDMPAVYFEKDPLLGIISCRQMQYYSNDKIDGLYHLIKPDLSITPFGMNQIYDPKCKRHSCPGFVISANGGSAIYRRAVLEQTGGLDERFFAYFEEVDLCFRAFFLGWKCLYSPLSVVFHKGSVSFSKNMSRMYFYRERNKLLFMYKNLPCRYILKRILPILIWEVRVIRVFFKEGQPLLYFRARSDAINKMRFYRELRKKNLVLLKDKMNLFNKLLKEKIIFIAS
jgi:GT2 family glycosyltransferase